MPSLGEELTRLRKLKGYTLREVEQRTGKRVSNSYLYQLEAGEVKEPSPNILYEIAKVYQVPYKALMQLAGYIAPVKNGDRSRGHASVAFSVLQDLTDDERDQVLDYIEFLRRKKRNR
jgi:transcriptional regulator with XRE-family HTH domain